MFDINLRTIKHEDQRYNTVGDWQMNKETGDILITTSKMGDWRKEVCVHIHEFVESMLCLARNIREEDVDKFDMEYEKNRLSGDISEPGNHPDAPYFKEHQVATRIEQILAAELGVDWHDYEKTINDLG